MLHLDDFSSSVRHGQRTGVESSGRREQVDLAHLIHSTAHTHTRVKHVTCPTRDSNILDHCYTAIKDAYHSVPRAALGLSDHCLVHLIPTYRQKMKSAKPVLKTVNRWTNEAERDLQACFDLTDWTVFEAAAADLDELTETVTIMINRGLLGN